MSGHISRCIQDQRVNPVSVDSDDLAPALSVNSEINKYLSVVRNCALNLALLEEDLVSGGVSFHEEIERHSYKYMGPKGKNLLNHLKTPLETVCS